MSFGKRLTTVLAALTFGVIPALADPFDPTGLWEASDGESRYNVTLCGDGTQLCAKLIWIRPDVTTDRNRPYIDTYVVEGADRRGDGEWRGTIRLYGFNVAGSVKRLEGDMLQVRGCALLVICENKTLSRISSEIAESN